MKRIFITLTVLIMLPLSAARSELNAEWMKLDQDMVRDVVSVLPFDHLSYDEIDKRFHEIAKDKKNASFGIVDLGFEATRYIFILPGGYSTATVKILFFEKKPYYSQVYLRASETSPVIKEEIKKAWRKNNGPAFDEEPDGFTITKRNQEREAAFKQHVANELGPQQPVTMNGFPADQFHQVNSPLTYYSVGEMCGVGAVVPDGKKAIDHFIEINHWDWVENLLRGYNPEGRVQAALTLLLAEKKGRVLSADIKAAINKVFGLPIPVSHCEGCMVSGGDSAQVILKLYEERLR